MPAYHLLFAHIGAVAVGATLAFVGLFSTTVIERHMRRCTKKTLGKLVGDARSAADLGFRRWWSPLVGYHVGGTYVEAEAVYNEGLRYDTPVGTECEVYYDPEKPMDCYALLGEERTTIKMSRAMIYIGAALITLAVIIAAIQRFS